MDIGHAETFHGKSKLVINIITLILITLLV